MNSCRYPVSAARSTAWAFRNESDSPLKTKSEFEVLAYYAPCYHPDPRNDALRGVGWTMWELVKNDKPGFKGHRQPRVPMWGYEDESDPAVMAKKIDAAADHGLTGFIFDWYWHDDGPFLDRCFERGFLHAPNNDRLKFALMWANHTWTDVHPAKNNVAGSTVLYKGAVTRPRRAIVVRLLQPSLVPAS